MKVSWTVAVAFFAIMLAQLLMFLVAWYFKIPAAFNSEAELASILAALFTVGSVIIALVAFYTQSNAESVVNRAVSVALDEANKKTENRIQTFLRAYSAFRAAQERYSQDQRPLTLQFVEHLANNAQDIEPSLYGVDEWLGEIFFRGSQRLFLMERHFIDQSRPEDFAQRAPLAVKALRRLETAIAKGQAEPKGYLALCIAEVHALIGNSPKEITEWLRKVKDLPWFFDDTEALTVLSTCKRKAEAESLLFALNFEALSLAQVRQSGVTPPKLDTE